jgi:hypothetical protein
VENLLSFFGGNGFMDFLNFTLMITGRLYLWVFNRFIESVRDKAVKMVSEGKA